MQKFTVGDGGNIDGTAKDRVGLTAGTTLKAKYWNDNVFNLLEAVINAGYTLIDNDLSQLTKAFRGGYNSSYIYNTASIASQSVDDIVLGSDSVYYKCLVNGTTGDNPVGSVTGNWEVFIDPNIAKSINAATAKNTPIDADLLPLVDSAASNVLKKLSWLNLKATLKTYFDTLYSAIGSGSISGVRQTVQSASVDSNGYANFISIGTGLAVNIAATTTPIKIHAAGGAVNNDRLGTISADTTITGLTDNATNYLYADVASNGTVTLLANTVAHVEQFGGTPATTNNLLTLNYGAMIGYTGNGSTAPQTWRVPIGEAITSGGVVTSVVNYALNGRYETAWIPTLPSAATVVSKNHNIGYKEIAHSELALNTTTDLGWAVGDIVDLWNANGATGIPSNNIGRTSRNAYQVTSGANGWATMLKGGSNFSFMTAASWSYKFKAWRGF